jgi:transcriptional accessory protein Tex/SPT6
MDFIKQISTEFSVTQTVASNVIRLLSEGCTVPFIARYRNTIKDTILRKELERIL